MSVSYLVWFSSSGCLCFAMLVTIVLCTKIITNSDRALTQVSIVCCHCSLLLVVLHSLGRHAMRKIHHRFDENKLAISCFLFFIQLALCEIWRESKVTERQSENVFSSVSTVGGWNLWDQLVERKTEREPPSPTNRATWLCPPPSPTTSRPTDPDANTYLPWHPNYLTCYYILCIFIWWLS